MSKIDAEGRTITSVSEIDKLNETIAWARDMAYGDIFDDIGWYEAQRYEKVANWLEDYKDYRNANFDLSQVADNRYIEGYTQGIEDFVDKVEFVVGAEDRDIYCKEIVKEVAEQLKEVAEQLKEGSADNE